MSEPVVDTGLSALLEAGLAAAVISLSPSQQDKLLRFVKLLDKWNKTYNLTAVREPERMVGMHILDSLSVLPFLDAHSILDVGTGGGLPGIPLAIARPQTSVTMLDSLQKKTTFVRQAIAELGLANAGIVCERIEQFQAPVKFDIVISRAFSELGDFVKAAAGLVADNGRMFAMKGVYPHDEIARLPAGIEVQQVIELFVPQVAGKRHLVVLKKA